MYRASLNLTGARSLAFCSGGAFSACGKNPDMVSVISGTRVVWSFQNFRGTNEPDLQGIRFS